MNEKETITITLEEYKELLEIKGKYKELKVHPEIKYIYVYVPSTPGIPWKPNEPFYYDPYKITCNNTTGIGVTTNE